MGSKRFTIDGDDLRSLAWAILDSGLAIVIAWAASIQTTEPATLAIIGMISVGMKAARKWISDNTKRWTAK